VALPQDMKSWSLLEQIGLEARPESPGLDAVAEGTMVLSPKADKMKAFESR